MEDHLAGYQWGNEMVQGSRSIIGRNKQREFKNSIENGEVKELTCTTHGHEVKGGRG